MIASNKKYRFVMTRLTMCPGFAVTVPVLRSCPGVLAGCVPSNFVANR